MALRYVLWSYITFTVHCPYKNNWPAGSATFNCYCPDMIFTGPKPAVKSKPTYQYPSREIVWNVWFHELINGSTDPLILFPVNIVQFWNCCQDEEKIIIIKLK